MCLFLFISHELLHHFHKVPDLMNHAARFRRVLALHHLVHPAQTETTNRGAHIIGAADEALDPLHFHGSGALRALLFACHAYSPAAFSTGFSATTLGGLPLISSMVLERVSATCPASFKLSSAANVALMTLCGLDVPNDLVSTLVIPATCITLRTGPPAITPVPSEAGFSSTCAEPYRPVTWCGIVVPFIFNLIRFFFACSIPFLMAMGTSRALPIPKPAWPRLSPTTTSAEKLRFLPPLTTLVTRLIAITSSFRSEGLTSNRRRTARLSRKICFDIGLEL